VLQRRAERAERESAARGEEKAELEARVQALAAQVAEAARGAGAAGAEAEEALLARRAALEEETRALARRAQAQRRHAVEAREHLAALAGKERDLMAAIDGLRVRHSGMLQAAQRAHAPPLAAHAGAGPRGREGGAGARLSLPGAGQHIVSKTGTRAHTPSVGGSDNEWGTAAYMQQPYEHFLPVREDKQGGDR
jgi:hypothetical protein